MAEFCSGPLWNTTLTWNSEKPDFTSCFHKTVLVYMPCFVLWILAPLEIWSNCKSSKRFIQFSWVNVSKILLDFCLVATTTVELLLINRLYNNPDIGNGSKMADFVASGLKLITFCLDFALVLLAKRSGRVTSGVQFMFWTLITLCLGLTMGSVISDGEASLALGGSKTDDIIASLEFAFCLLGFIVHCFADKTPIYAEIQDDTYNLSPETTSSVLSRIFFFWFEKTVWRGRSKTIDFNDVWTLNPEDSVTNIGPLWDQLWKEEVTKYKHSKKKPSILIVLFKAFGSIFTSGAICQLIFVLVQFASPLLLDLIITFVQGNDPVWRGYLYTVILSVAALIGAMSDSQYWYRMRMVGLRIQTAISTAIYKKALVLSSLSRRQKTAGEIVNLINVDCQKLTDACLMLNLLWSAPLQVGLSIYFLYQTIGVAVFVGLGVLVILFPINALIWSFMEKYQSSQMKKKDNRVKLISEILSGIKVIKLYAWELSFIKRINNLRKEEVNELKSVQLLEGALYFVWSVAPLLVALVSFLSFVLIDPENNILDTQTAFVSMTLFNTMRGPLFMLPFGIVSIIQGAVSLGRINHFLNLNELDKNAVSHNEDTPHPISLKHASFKWSENPSDLTTLRGISLDINEGSLVAVVGNVGSGKSSLISALLGEMTRVEGEVNLRGRVAYVPQQAWMRNATLKNNILFGKKFNSDIYNKVIDACALRADLEILTGGDETEIGEKGINLSGGQKQRVSLARAVYNNADVYLLDDPLSAVDSHVGKHIFDKVIGPKGALRQKTRILVTHGITFLPFADQIVVLKDGKISELGTYEELMKNRGAFAEFLMEQLQEHDSDSSVTESEREDLRLQLAESFAPLQGLARTSMKQKSSKKPTKRIKTTSIGSLSDNLSDHESLFSLALSRRSHNRNMATSRHTSVVHTLHKEKENQQDQKEFKVGRDLVEDETTETERVKFEIYIYYAKAMGLALVIISVVLYAFFQGFNIGGNFWLSIWAEDPEASVNTAVRNKYLAVYGILGLFQSVSVLGAVIVVTLGTLKSSIKLHKELLEHILLSTMAFFDTTPIGRIINRFSKDIDEVDLMIPTHVKDILTDFFSVIGTLFVVCYASPIIIALVVPLIFLFFFIQNSYLAVSRQLKRMVSVTRSPINSSLTESYNGSPTIRAFKMENAFIEENNNRIEVSQQCYYPEIASNSWLFSRLEILANLLIVFTSLFVVIFRDTMDPGMTGLSLTYTFTFQLDIYFMTRYFAELEKSIVSVERIREYQHTEIEAAFEKPATDPPKSWPENGKIVFDNYQTRYRKGLDLVLRGVSFEVAPGEKVGIVGRTGAGKSSLTLALFRMIEAAGGCIKIDDINIAELGLLPLRSSLTIIPQDPVLFSGTMRLNLDPFGTYSDAALWVTLEHAHLKSFMEKLPDGLDYEVTEGGENLSVGQRQLVCLARALLRKTKILVLDEATAAVDLETDDLIQATIRAEFSDCTVLTIAHRLKTIMDSDKILLLDAGLVKEFDSPENLLDDERSAFYSMAKDAGLV